MKHDYEKWFTSGSSVWSEYGCICVSVNTKKNARLIAAAPELLEALLEADEQLELEGYDPEGLTRSVIRAAIRKATGADNGN